MNLVQQIVNERLALERELAEQKARKITVLTAIFLTKLAKSPNYQIFLRESVENYSEIASELSGIEGLEVWPVSGGVMVHTSAQRLLEANLSKYF